MEIIFCLKSGQNRVTLFLRETAQFENVNKQNSAKSEK
jgi:hypothetical protein